MIGMCMRHTKDEMTALSIVNDGFVKVFKNIDQFQNKGALQGWIKRVVFNCLSDHFRKKSNHFFTLPVKEESKVPDIIGRLYYEEILDMVDQLEPITKDVFLLHAVEGYKHREIADILDIPENTSKWHLARARQMLKKLIGKSNLMRNKKRNEQKYS